MHQNFSKLEMQIPQENTYIGMEIMQNSQNNFKEYLNQRFNVNSNNLNEICNFIENDNELKKIICNLHNIISSELDYNRISIDFMKETDPSEKIIEIVICCNEESEILLEKEDLICDRIIDRYPKTEIEYIILVEPYEERKI